jgi:nitrite reductase/ring-hydroxylating ferredoxin subunit
MGVTRYRGNTMRDDQKDIGLDLTQWAKVERVPEGEILAGVVGKDRVFVWRNGNGLKAYGASCPHLGAPLNEGIVVGATIRCPWHHACFDLATGEATAAPAFDALLEYAVTLDGDRFSVRPAHAKTPRRTGRREDSLCRWRSCAVAQRVCCSGRNSKAWLAWRGIDILGGARTAL